MLDTNAVSETRKTRPNSEFMAWLGDQELAHLFITTITMGEAWLGLDRLQPKQGDVTPVTLFRAGSRQLCPSPKYFVANRNKVGMLSVYS